MGLLENLIGTSVDDPRFAATTQLAQGLLSSPRLMQGLAQGLGGYQQAMAQAKQAKMLEEMRQMQMAQQKMQMEAAQKEQARKEGIEQDYRDAWRTPEQMAVGKFGPTPEAAAAIPQTQGGFDKNYLIDALAKRDPLTAYQLAQPKQRKIKDYKEIRNPDGSVTIAGFDEEGNVVDTKAQPFKAAEIRDGGGAIVGIDPITGKMQVLGNKTQSPDSKASNALGWANYGLSKDRLNFDRTNNSEGKAPQGYRWKPDGTLEPIKGGPADRQATASEGERKAATLLARLEGSEAQIRDALKESPGAAKPGVWASMAGSTPFIGESFRNTVNSPARQRVEAAQLDMLDAALTLGTGAAYTREQLEGYRRSYFPQIGDDDATVADKQKRLETVIRAARISAGRAAQPSGGSDGISGVDAALSRARQNPGPLNPAALTAALDAYGNY
jgi:hypothetical protein